MHREADPSVLKRDRLLQCPGPCERKLCNRDVYVAAPVCRLDGQSEIGRVTHSTQHNTSETLQEDYGIVFETVSAPTIDVTDSTRCWSSTVIFNVFKPTISSSVHSTCALPNWSVSTVGALTHAAVHARLKLHRDSEPAVALTRVPTNERGTEANAPVPQSPSLELLGQIAQAGREQTNLCDVA